MLKFHVVTLFPELIFPYFQDSILNRAIKNKILEVSFYNLRDYSSDKHKQVDDTPCGGGPGMLLKVDVLYNAVTNIKNKLNDVEAKVVYLSPQGLKLTNIKARSFSKYSNLILVCGRYEGVDQRFIELLVDEEISIGDYVLNGGELPACVLIEAVSRFLPKVVGNLESVDTDSFENGYLKYPQYTRPVDFNGLKVPEVLLSGNHQAIKNWREEEACNCTKKKRKDLI